MLWLKSLLERRGKDHTHAQSGGLLIQWLSFSHLPRFLREALLTAVGQTAISRVGPFAANALASALRRVKECLRTTDTTAWSVACDVLCEVAAIFSTVDTLRGCFAK
jgi:hypothetical protein